MARFLYVGALEPRRLPGWQLAARMADKDLTWTRDFLFRVGDNLLPLCEPTHRARDCEHDREHRNWQTHCLIDDAGVKIDVRVKFA